MTLIPFEAKLIILMGIPGCGKSTFAARMFENHVVSSDAIREKLTGDEANQVENDTVFTLFHERIEEILYRRMTAIADSTALTPEARERLRLCARSHEASTHLILFDNCAAAKVRNRTRPNPVPDDVMRRMWDRFQVAKSSVYHEGYSSITRIEGVV